MNSSSSTICGRCPERQGSTHVLPRAPSPHAASPLVTWAMSTNSATRPSSLSSGHWFCLSQVADSGSGWVSTNTPFTPTATAALAIVGTRCLEPAVTVPSEGALDAPPSKR